MKDLQQEVVLEQQNFPQGNLSNKEYGKKVLAEMYMFDQKVREELIEEFGPDLSSGLEALQLISSMDDFHTAKVKEMLQ